MIHNRSAWFSDFKLPGGTVVARVLLVEDEPRRIQIHVLSPEWAPSDVASSPTQAQRLANELVSQRWPVARAGDWLQEAP